MGNSLPLSVSSTEGSKDVPEKAKRGAGWEGSFPSAPSVIPLRVLPDSVAPLGDTGRVALACLGGDVCVLDVDHEEVVSVLPGTARGSAEHAEATLVYAMDDDTILVVSSDATLTVWSLTTACRLDSLSSAYIVRVLFQGKVSSCCVLSSGYVAVVFTEGDYPVRLLNSSLETVAYLTIEEIGGFDVNAVLEMRGERLGLVCTGSELEYRLVWWDVTESEGTWTSRARVLWNGQPDDASAGDPRAYVSSGSLDPEPNDAASYFLVSLEECMGKVQCGELLLHRLEEGSSAYASVLFSTTTYYIVQLCLLQGPCAGICACVCSDGVLRYVDAMTGEILASLGGFESPDIQYRRSVNVIARHDGGLLFCDDTDLVVIPPPLNSRGDDEV